MPNPVNQHQHHPEECSFLETFADNHFAETDRRAEERQSLVAAVQKSLSIETLLEILGTGRMSLQRLAARELQKRRAEPEVHKVIQTGLRVETTRLAMLTALSYLPLEYDRATIDLVAEQLTNPDADIREAALKVIVFQYPQAIDDHLLPLLHGNADQKIAHKQVARWLCFSERTDLIPLVSAKLGFPEHRLPPVIGLLVTPEWLGESHERHPQLVQNLAAECGFSDRVEVDQAAPLWQEGLMFVGPELARSNVSPSEIRKRIFDLCFHLLPFDVEMEHRQNLEFAADNPLDLELLIAALRQADRINLDTLKTRCPFDYRHRASPRILACSHASARFVRTQFIDAAKETAEEMRINPHHWGRFLLEWGRANLEVDDERRTEADLFLRSRWWAIGQSSHLQETIPRISFPVKSFEDLPFGIETFLQRPLVDWEYDPRIAPGTNAICQFAANSSRPELVDWLIEKEQLWSGRLPPIGCELQIPDIDRNTSLLRKQMLRQLGTPSPRRPEYRQMVEAAFRPSASWHAMLVGPWLLADLGVIDRPQEMALHISIQGEVGPKIRHLAVCSSFIHPRRKKRAKATLTRVMSKGLVCCNRDIEPCLPEFTADCRTEIRLFRCFSNENDRAQITLDPGYMDDILATHVLATAAMSREPALSERYDKFCRHVEAAIDGLPPEFATYMNSDFHQATGDPYDPELLDVVPIFRARNAVRDVIEAHNMTDELERTFLEIRDAATWDILRMMTPSESAARNEWNPDEELHAMLPTAPQLF